MKSSIHHKCHATAAGLILLMYVPLLPADQLPQSTSQAAAAEQPSPMALSADMADRLFEDARRAYDHGALTKARNAYRRLLHAGYCLPQVFFNLGNTLYRSGAFGEAILAYRRAWILSPTDPDIRANLRFAMSHAKSLTPRYNAAFRLLFTLSLRSWLVVFLVSYWLSAGLATLLLLLKGNRYALRRLLIISLISLFLAMPGIVAWLDILFIHPEAVVVSPKNTKVYFAPSTGATVHFEAPSGSIVKILDNCPGWLHITTAGKRGWLQASRCRRVWPLLDG